MSKETKIVLGVCLVIVAALVLLIVNYSGTSTKIEPGSAMYERLERANSHRTGQPGAKVTLVEFADFQCPACAYVAPITEQVVAAYKDNPDFSFVFRHFPFPQHQNAIAAAAAAEAAGQQGKFWEMYHEIFANQTEWESSANAAELFAGYAQGLSLGVDQFKADSQSDKYDDFITNDAKDGIALGVNSTPTFFLNGEPIVGVQTFEEFKAMIDAKLK